MHSLEHRYNKIGNCTTTTTTTTEKKKFQIFHTKYLTKYKVLFGVKRQQYGSRRGLRKKKNLKKFQKEKERNLTENSVHTFFPK